MNTKTLLLGCSTLLIAITLAILGTLAYFFVYFGPQWKGPTNFAQQRFKLAANALATPDRPLDPADGNWSIYARIRTITIATHERVLGYTIRQPSGGFNWPDIFDPVVPSPDPAPAQALIAALEAAGVFADLDRLAADPRAVRPAGEGDDPFAGIPDLSVARQLTRINSFRFRNDIASGQFDAALIHLRRNLALSQTISSQASQIETLVGIAISARVLGDMRDALLNAPASAPLPEPTLAQFQSIAQATRPPDLRVALEGERLIALNAIYTTLSNRRVTMANRAANMNHLNSIYDQIIPLSSLSSAERRAGALAQEDFPAARSKLYPATTLLIPTFFKLFQADDQFQLDRASTITLLAIERFRLLNSKPPAKLSDLGPLLPAIPPDPFSKTGLIYRPDAAAHRGYVLYSTGLDGTDDGRKQNPKVNFDALTPEGTGTDYFLYPPFQQPPNQEP